MNALKTLESNVTKWAGEVTERKKRVKFLRDEIDRLVSEIVDAKDPKRGIARTQRAEYVAELDALEGEFQEVTRRYDVAVQAVNEYKIQQAQDVYNAADKISREKRAVLVAAQDAKLRHMNAGGRKAEDEASINKGRDIGVAIVNAQAELTIANRQKEQAGKLLQSLRGE
jgi:hypothetical protein